MSAEDPVAWLRAQVQARKVLAAAATQAPWEPEGDDPTDDEVWIDVDGEQWRHVICRGPQSHQNMLHIAANDPRDTIARCEAELAILDEHGGEHFCFTKTRDGNSYDWYIGDCRVLRQIASGYRHHPGYREEAWNSAAGNRYRSPRPI